MNTCDTITAPASAIGGAVTILRISGPNALQTANAVWHGKQKLGEKNVRQMLLGKVGGNPTLAVYMKAPASYTGDDVVELQCHGGAAASQSVLQEILKHDCRMAEPGEFTFRAFVNGKLDLTQAEAVADLLSSGSTEAMHLAERQLAGQLSDKLNDLYDRINFLRSECEAHLDFPDEELDFARHPEDEIAVFLKKIDALLSTRNAGDNLRNGIDVVLAGRPNAGKSSLLNLLVGYDRAIVSNIAGTTRDTLEAQAVIGGIPVHLTDTAGLRDSDDPIEEQGVERSRRHIASAQVTFWLLDSSADDLAQEIRELTANRPRKVIAVWNKCDLSAGRALPELPCPSVKLSALTGTGLEELTRVFSEMINSGKEDAGIPEVSVNARMSDALERSKSFLYEAEANLRDCEWELAAADLALAAEAVGETTGKTSSPDLLDQVFHRFCLGK